MDPFQIPFRQQKAHVKVTIQPPITGQIIIKKTLIKKRHLKVVLGV